MVEFQCPGCRSRLVNHGDREAGYWVCIGCGVAFPQVDGTSYFDRPTLAPVSAPDLKPALCALLFGDEKAYALFIASKHLRPQHDAYAAFEPFNESTRALYAFLDEIRQSLKPGVPILDLWGRTAWSGASLATFFPNNPVYMLWEGDRNLLGYKGYRYWLGQQDRPSNLHIVFTDLEKPLPFPNLFFGLVHGLDTLHRYGPVPLIGECLRVAATTAPLIFPHIHLSNSEPEPFFDRGCLQHHGTEYRRLMDIFESAHDRRSYLLSEKTLFENQQRLEVIDDHRMTHYNALLYVSPVGNAFAQIGPCNWPEANVGADTRVILNPLIRIDPVTGMADLNRTAMGGEGQHILERHPLYEERLRQCIPYQLEDTDRQLLFCFERGMAVGAVSRLMNLSDAEIGERLSELQALEICTFGAFGAGTAQLQRFYRTQRADHPLQQVSDFFELWKKIDNFEKTEPVFISTAQGVEYGWDDVKILVGTIRSRFHKAGLRKGQRILICSSQHPAYLLTLWAAWLSGLIAVPVCPSSHGPHLDYIVDIIEPDFIFIEPGVNLPVSAIAATVVFDALKDDATAFQFGLSFSDWLECTDAEDAPEYESCETAVILFSSGTTGKPKAIVHSFSTLLQGSIKLAQFYQLEPHTRMLSVGGFHSMSGLRNAAVLSLVNHQTVLLADGVEDNLPLRFLDIVRTHRPQLIFSSPALIDALARIGDRLEGKNGGSIDTWLCTGASVSQLLLQRLAKKFNIRFATYYGLTETGGFCAGTQLNEVYEEGELGEPVGAIFKILDAQGKTLDGEGVGKLHVFSDQLMLGYLTAIEPWQERWLDTGDTVRRTVDGRLVLLGRGEDEFSNSAGELVNLGFLETELAHTLDMAFALLHDGYRMTLVIECASETFGLLQKSQTLQPLLIQLSERGAGTLSELQIAHIEKFPRTGNGKIQRSTLNQQLFHD